MKRLLSFLIVFALTACGGGPPARLNIGGQDRATVDAFMKKLGVGYPAALDEDSKIAKRYGVVGLPTTFLIDGQGIVRGKIVGEADAAILSASVLFGKLGPRLRGWLLKGAALTVILLGISTFWQGLRYFLLMWQLVG